MDHSSLPFVLILLFESSIDRLHCADFNEVHRRFSM